MASARSDDGNDVLQPATKCTDSNRTASLHKLYSEATIKEAHAKHPFQMPRHHC